MLVFRHLIAISACTTLALSSQTAATAQITQTRSDLPTNDDLVASQETQKQFPRITSTQELDPSPNPLLFPTNPEEVEIKKLRAITLQQAIEAGQRNNRQLQRSRLELERSRFQLREASADLFPSLDGQLNYQQK